MIDHAAIITCRKFIIKIVTTAETNIITVVWGHLHRGILKQECMTGVYDVLSLAKDMY